MREGGPRDAERAGGDREAPVDRWKWGGIPKGRPILEVCGRRAGPEVRMGPQPGGLLAKSITGFWGGSYSTGATISLRIKQDYASSH